MQIETLIVESRKATGTRAAARLRRAGKLPAVLYGHRIEPVTLSLDCHAVEMQLAHGAHLINLAMEGKEQPCLIKDVQYDHLGSKLVHVDLARVDLSERVKVHVPIELRGHPKGVHDGGVLMHELASLEVECRVSDIPESIRVEVADMELDQVMHVKDLVLGEGITATSDPEAVVAMVRMPAAKAAAIAEVIEGEPTEAEPEVIAKGKGEEDSEKSPE